MFCQRRGVQNKTHKTRTHTHIETRTHTTHTAHVRTQTHTHRFTSTTAHSRMHTCTEEDRHRRTQTHITTRSRQTLTAAGTQTHLPTETWCSADTNSRTETHGHTSRAVHAAVTRHRLRYRVICRNRQAVLQGHALKKGGYFGSVLSGLRCSSMRALCVCVRVFMGLTRVRPSVASVSFLSIPRGMPWVGS